MALGSDTPDVSQGDVAPFVGDTGTLSNGLDRSRFAAELAANPALREHVMAISAGENLHHDANLAVIESMMNRADMMGTPLAVEGRTTGQGGYYAGYNPRALSNPATRAMIEANLDKAINGSNVSNYATDNSSEGTNNFSSRRFASGMYTPTFNANGEFFSYPSNSTARGFGQYQDWLQRVGGNAPPSNSLPANAGSQEDQFTAALANKQQPQPLQTPVPVAGIAPPNAIGPQPTPGIFGSIASGLGLPQDITNSLTAANGNQSSGNDASNDAAKALQAAISTTQKAAANTQVASPKPVDMSRVAALIQQLQGPMGSNNGNLGTAQQQGLGSYFGAIG